MERSDTISALGEIRDPEYLFARQFLSDAGVDLEKQPEAAREYLEARVAENVDEARLALSKLLLTGLVGEIDSKRAFDLCEQAANRGYPPAVVFLSAFYASGWGGIPRDYSKALTLLQQGAAAGYAHAIALLGTAYREGILVPVDVERGRKLLFKAAECGDGGSQFLMGNELIREKDPKQVSVGVTLLLAAASQDLSSAHRLLADLYASGIGDIPRDIKKSAFHRQRAQEIDDRI
jgi:TPR repeat protein